MLVVGAVFGQHAAENQISFMLEKTIGQKAAEYIEGNIVSAAERTSSNPTLFSLISLGILLYAATNLFKELKLALDAIWGIPPLAQRGVFVEIKTRLVSLMVVFVIGFFFLSLMVINVVFSAIDAFIAVGDNFHIIQLTGLVVSFGALTFLIAIIYKFVPDTNLAWGDVWIGSAVTAILLNLSFWGIGVYMRFSNAGSIFGAAEALIIILLWIYYTAQVFLFGAAFTRAYATNFGSKKET